MSINKYTYASYSLNLLRLSTLQLSSPLWETMSTANTEIDLERWRLIAIRRSPRRRRNRDQNKLLFRDKRAINGWLAATEYHYANTDITF